MTAQGGVKTTKIAGEIFNNANDNKGHHDTYRWWWEENVGKNHTFPDTSNTHFQSHCEAAAILLQYLPHFIKFLEFVASKKQAMKLNHMEQNLWNALHCTATKTELAVLALYAQAISHPYFRKTRGVANEGVNMLDLGPLHIRVYEHMQKIIANPSLLLGLSASSETGALDGESWQSPEVITAIQQLMPELPHLKPVLIAFFEGAAETWKRFTSEFAPGGLIDEATVEEKDLAWMPPTNDMNEGALGAFRVLMRRQYQLSPLQYNAQAMFYFNKTQEFMDKKFEPEDHIFIRGMARNLETQGLVKKRKKQIVQHQQTRAAKNVAAKEKRKKNAAIKANRVANITFIDKKEDIVKLKGQLLKDTLEAYISWGAPISGITVRSPVAAIREALSVAVEHYTSGEWKPSMGSDSDSASSEDSGEGFDLEGIDSEEEEGA